MFVLILLLSPSGAALVDYVVVVAVVGDGLVVCSNVVAIDYAGGGSVVVVASAETRASGTTRRVTRSFFGVGSLSKSIPWGRSSKPKLPLLKKIGPLPLREN